MASGEFHEIGAGGADGDGVQSTEFIEIRPLARSKAGLGVLHYLDKTLAEVDAKKRHSVRMTEFLMEASRSQRLHPIFGCVQIFGRARQRYYIARSIPGETWSACVFLDEESEELSSTIFDIARRVLRRNTHDLGITFGKPGKDIKPWNFLINQEMYDFIEDERQKTEIQHIENIMPVARAVQEEVKILDQWAAAGARIYLFDFGTWKLPK